MILRKVAIYEKVRFASCAKNGAIGAFLAMLKKVKLFFFILTIAFLSSCRTARYVPEDHYLLDQNVITSTDPKVKSRDMRPYLKQRPNLKILGVFRFHLAVYNSSGKKDKKLNKMLRRIGEAPVVYDEYLRDKSRDELKQYLSNKGYTDAVVTDSVVLHPKRKRAVVHYNVDPGIPYRIQNHSMRFFNDDIKYLVEADSAKSLIKEDMNFDLDILDDERERITRYLRQKGYYKFTKNSITFNVDTTLGNKMVADTLIVNNPYEYTSDGKMLEKEHEKYTIRNVYFITDYQPQIALRNSSYLETKQRIEEQGRVFLYDEELKIKPEILLNNTLIEPGTEYNHRQVTKTHSLLLSMPIIQYDNIKFVEHYEEGKALLDCYINLTQAKSQSFTLDLEGTNSNGNMGAAIRVGYQHRNLFRGAEVFNASAVVGRETQSSISRDISFNSQQMGINTSLVYPKFIFPGFSARLQKSLKASTAFSANYHYQRRPDYTRYIAQLAMKYNWKGESLWAKTLTLIDFNYVGIPYMSELWKDRIEGTFEEYSYEAHVIHGSGFTMTFNDQQRENFRSSRYLRLNFEAAGNLLNFVHNVGGGQVDTTGANAMFGVPISQYVKMDVDGVYNHFINEKNRIAYHLTGGVALPYGNRNVLPFEKRYFGGGANSLRAWRVRSLGPGTYTDSLNVNQLGDIRLEANVEYRFKLVAMLEGALFFDAGNIWTIYDYSDQPGGVFRLNSFLPQVAMGYGVGLRLDLNFFIFRLDMGVKFRDPQRPMSERWVWNPSYDDTAFNFAIGYPF